MTAPTEAKAPCPLAVMDDQHSEFLRAGLYSGEGCWFSHGDDADYAAAYLKARAKVAARFEAADNFHAATVEYIEARDEYDRAAERYGDESNAAPMCDARGRVLRAVKAYRAALAAFSEVQP